MTSRREQLYRKAQKATDDTEHMFKATCQAFEELGIAYEVAEVNSPEEFNYLVATGQVKLGGRPVVVHINRPVEELVKKMIELGRV